MKNAELREALAKFREATGRDSVQSYDVRNIITLGVEKYSEVCLKFKAGSVDFSGMDLSGIELEDMLFGNNETLAQASLIGGKFRDSAFSGTDLTGTDFSWADLSGCEFRWCRLENACFQGAVMNGTVFESKNIF